MIPNTQLGVIVSGYCWVSAMIAGSRAPDRIAIMLITEAVASAQRAACRNVAVRRCCNSLARSRETLSSLRAWTFELTLAAGWRPKRGTQHSRQRSISYLFRMDGYGSRPSRDNRLSLTRRLSMIRIPTDRDPTPRGDAIERVPHAPWYDATRLGQGDLGAVPARQRDCAGTTRGLSKYRLAPLQILRSLSGILDEPATPLGPLPRPAKRSRTTRDHPAPRTCQRYRGRLMPPNPTVEYTRAQNGRQLKTDNC